MIADRQPEPPRRTTEYTAREALRNARDAGNAAVAACVLYAFSPSRLNRELLEDCAELLRSGAVPDDTMPVPVYERDRAGISL
jgi:hypothetical protein